MKFKVGDRVEHDFYGMGTVIGVSSRDTPLVEFDNHFSKLHDGGRGEVNGIRGKDGHCWYTDMIKPLGTQTIVIYSKGLETIALLKEGKKVIKQASAKCNPSDTFDFNIGAKLAFNRLMGEEVREVKRPAKAGEWIKIIDGAGSALSKVGDLARVTRVWYGNNGVDYITDYGVETGGLHKRYVVLENSQPEATKALSDYTDKELIDELAKRLEDKK